MCCLTHKSAKTGRYASEEENGEDMALPTRCATRLQQRVPLMSEEKGSPTSPNVPERWEYQQEKKRNERQMSKTMEHSGSEDMTSHTEQQAGPRSRHTDAAVVRLRRRKAEESGKVARNAVQRDQRSALGRSAGIASQPLFPGQTVVGTLRTGKDNRLFFGAQLGRRRGLYVHPLTAQQLSTGSPLLSARERAPSPLDSAPTHRAGGQRLLPQSAQPSKIPQPQAARSPAAKSAGRQPQQTPSSAVGSQ